MTMHTTIGRGTAATRLVVTDTVELTAGLRLAGVRRMPHMTLHQLTTFMAAADVAMMQKRTQMLARVS
jgi:hypothetical protein